MRFDERAFTHQCEKRKRKCLRVSQPLEHFHWSFSSDIMEMKGLILAYSPHVRSFACVYLTMLWRKMFINLCMYVCLSVILRHAQFWTCYRGFDKNLFSFFSWLYQSLVISYLSWQPIRDKKKKKKKKTKTQKQGDIFLSDVWTVCWPICLHN